MILGPAHHRCSTPGIITLLPWISTSQSCHCLWVLAQVFVDWRACAASVVLFTIVHKADEVDVQVNCEVGVVCFVVCKAVGCGPAPLPLCRSYWACSDLITLRTKDTRQSLPASRGPLFNECGFLFSPSLPLICACATRLAKGALHHEPKGHACRVHYSYTIIQC